MIDASQLLSHVFPKYLKVTNIAMVHMLGFVKDKRCFNSIAFLRNKVCNHLNNHLQLIVESVHLSFSHLAPFHTRLPMRCGLNFK